MPPLALFRALAAADGLFWPFLLYSSALWTRTRLDPPTRELVILRVAATEHSDYELAQHLPLARRVGLSESAIAAALRRPPPDAGLNGQPLTQAQRDALVVADAVLERGEATPPPGAGARDPVATEAALLAGHYLAIARLTKFLALQPDKPARRPAGLPGRQRQS